MKNLIFTILSVVSLIFIFVECSGSENKYYYKGVKLYQSNNYDSAIYYLKKAYGIGRQDTSVDYFLGASYYHLSNYDSAKIYFYNALDEGGGNTDLYYKIGITEIHRGFYDKEFFLQTIKYDSTHQQAWYYAGLCYAKQDDFEKAYQFFNKAIALDSTDHLSFHMRARVFYTTDSFEAALKDVDKALELHDSSYYFYQKAVMLFELERDEESINYADKALGKDSLFVDALYYKALSLNALGKFEEACEEVSRIKSIQADIEEPWDLSEIAGKCK